MDIQAIREKNSGFEVGSTNQFVNAGAYQEENHSFQVEEEFPNGKVIRSKWRRKSVADFTDDNDKECVMLVGGGLAGLSADSHLPPGLVGNGEDGNKPLLSGGSAGLPSIKPDFLPLKVCVENPLEFAAVLGIVPDDFHSFDCTAAEDPLRTILNTSDEWIHSKTSPQQFIPPISPLTPDELHIEEFWKTVPFDIPVRITPFLRSSMMKSNDVEKWTALTQSLETLEEFGSYRDKSDAKMCLDYASQVPNLRSGKQLNHQVVWGQHMTLDDCCTQEVCISELCFTAVDYGDMIPTSEELQQILGFTQREEKNQCVLLHLAAALVHTEVGSKRSPPPASRVRLMAKSLRLLEAKQAHEIQGSTPQSSSRWGDELLSLCHDVLAESHDRDYRSLCIFFLEEFINHNMRVRVFDISAMNKSEPRLRINVFNAEGYSEDTGITIDLLSVKGHMRLLQRSPETNPSVWKKWDTEFADYICYYTVTGWRNHVTNQSSGESLRAMPCKVCKKRCKTPVTPTDFYLSKGPIDGSCPMTSVGSLIEDDSPLNEHYRQDEEVATNSLVKNLTQLDADIVGAGLESVPLPQRDVNLVWPIINHYWRGSVLPNENVTRYLQACAAPFSIEAVALATNLGDQLVVDYGKYHLAARAVQEQMMKEKDRLCVSAPVVTFNDPVLTDRLRQIHTTGAVPVFRGPTPQGLRCRGFPYDPSETDYILKKMWKDAQCGRLLFVSTRTISDEEPLICCPTTTVKKRLPDRRWAEERRIIWDGRFANLFMPKTDYFRPELPTIKDIAEHVIALKKSYPNVPIKCTKRDINSAFRQIRLHPDAASLFATEFQGSTLGLNYDIIVGYLVLPFGWTGAPGVFASIAEIITRFHNLSSPANPLWAGDHPFQSHLFVDDGILIEPDIAGRLEQSATTWECGSFLVIGNDALNEEKLRIEGEWKSLHIILGYEVDFENFTITLPSEKIIGAQVLLQSPCFTPGNRLLSLHDVQELRGNMTHWQGANHIWRFLAEPINRMLSYADSTETWIRCSQWDTWHCYWSVIFFLREMALKHQEVWTNLFKGHLEELLPVHKRISGPTQCLPILWTTGDATLTRFAAINWRTREFFSEPVKDFIAPFQRVMHDPCINENELVAQAAMIVEWAGKSIKEELIPGMDNMSALSWLNFGHSRHGPAARIQVGVFFWLAIHKIRISPFFLRSGHNFSSDFLTRTTETQIQEWADQHLMTRIRLGRRWENFVGTTLAMQQYPEMSVTPTVHYNPLKNLAAVFVELNPRSFSMCHFANGFGLRSEWLDPAHSEIAKLASTAGCCEYIDGPILLLTSFVTSSEDLENLEFTSRTAQPVFTIAVFHVDLDLRPNRLIWNQKLIIDSAVIGDVIAGLWNIWICGPFDLTFPEDGASTPPRTLQDVYDSMGWEFRSSTRSVLHFKPANDSLGKIITSHAFDGIRRYSIYSQLQLCDLGIIHWPLIYEIGAEPTFAQKIVALGGHPFWLNKSLQNDAYTADALVKCCPPNLWIYIFNALAVAASQSRFDEWSVQAHVHANRQAWTRGCFRNGHSTTSQQFTDIRLKRAVFVEGLDYASNPNLGNPLEAMESNSVTTPLNDAGYVANRAGVPADQPLPVKRLSSSILGIDNTYRAGGKNRSESESGSASEAGSMNEQQTDVGALLGKEEERRDWLCRSPSVASVDLKGDDNNTSELTIRERCDESESGSASEAGSMNGQQIDVGTLLDKEEERRDWLCRSPSVASVDLKGDDNNTPERSPSKWSGSESVFRAGGKRREEDDTDSHDAGSLSESDLFPSPGGSTFSTAATDVPTFNPMFDTPTGYSQHENVSTGQSVLTRSYGVSSRPCGPEVEDGVLTMRVRSHMGSVFSSDNGTVIDGRTSYVSNWNSCQSSNPSLSRGTSQNPNEWAVSKARPFLPRRDYRWNIVSNPQVGRAREGESSICSPYPCTPRSIGNGDQNLSEPKAQGKGSKDSIPHRRCGRNGQYIKDERPTTWSYAVDPRSAGMPPPERIVQPRNENEDPQLLRREPLIPAGNATSFHPVLPLPENDEQPTTVLLPYQPVEGNGNAPCLRRPRRLTPEENFRLMASVNENVRRRAECASQRNEARALWMRLRFPTPDDPFDPTEGFSDDAIRLAILGYTFLELAEEVGNSAARQHLHAEMMRLRSVNRNFRYMHHWAEYRDAYASYVNQIREFFPSEGR